MEQVQAISTTAGSAGAAAAAQAQVASAENFSAWPLHRHTTSVCNQSVHGLPRGASTLFCAVQDVLAARKGEADLAAKPVQAAGVQPTPANATANTALPTVADASQRAVVDEAGSKAAQSGTGAATEKASVASDAAAGKPLPEDDKTLAAAKARDAARQQAIDVRTALPTHGIQISLRAHVAPAIHGVRLYNA